MQPQFVTFGGWILGIYLALGVVFAVPFLWRWVGRIDPAARQGSLGFRLLIAPGTVALWPLLVRRLRASGPRAPRDSAHDLRPRAGQR